MSLKPEPPLQIDEAEVEQLIGQAQQGQLDAAAQQRLVPLLQTLVWLQWTLLETRISISKLRKLLFGPRTEKSTRKKIQDPPDEGADGEPAGGQDEPAAGQDAPPDKASATSPAHNPDNPDNPEAAPDGEAQSNAPRGHGRRGAADYPGAVHIVCTQETYRSGDHCPACVLGRLYRSRPLVRLRFTGQPLAQVTCYEVEQLRCGACDALFPAALPAPAGEDTYAISLKVNLAVAHYHLGLPFKRIEAFQDLLGMPLPDATQWDLVEHVADSAYPVYEQFKYLGAQQPLVYQDDTGARLLSLIKENQADPPPERKGMYTTVLQFEGEQAICLYVTGRQHAGENLDAILARRDPALPPIQWMSDALAANTPQQHQDKTLDLNCLVHYLAYCFMWSHGLARWNWRYAGAIMRWQPGVRTQHKISRHVDGNRRVGASVADPIANTEGCRRIRRGTRMADGPSSRLPLAPDGWLLIRTSWQLRPCNAARCAYCAVVLSRGSSNVQPITGFSCGETAGVVVEL